MIAQFFFNTSLAFLVKLFREGLGRWIYGEMIETKSPTLTRPSA